jgi:radical SAM superfamily enzyme YgiQ (UPF0313 family)
MIGKMHNIKRILLVSPSASTSESNIDINPLPPMGMGYLAATLRQYGFTVKIIDSLRLGWSNRVVFRPGMLRIGISDEDMAREIEAFSPDLVGISNLFSKQFHNALSLAKLVKGTRPGTPVVVGGAHPTAAPEMVLDHKEFDFLVEGEGEIPLLKLVQFLNGKLQESELEAVWVNNRTTPLHYPRKSFVDFNDIPYPAFDLMNLEGYFGLYTAHGTRKNPRFMPIITSRGCPAKCTFCSAAKVWGRKFRARDIENVIEEMRILKNEYGIQELMFEDDNTTLDVRRAKKLFERMKEERFGFEWDTPNGVAAFALDEELLTLMKDVGCYKVNLAIESGNQEHLTKNIRKPLKLKSVPSLVKHCQAIGLDVSVFLVFGMPGETEAVIWESARFVASMGIYSPHISIATPYPGTELFEICRQKGYLVEDFSLDDLYIRGYSISTPELPPKKLRKIVNRVELWLLFQNLKNNPWQVLSHQLFRTARNPFRIVKFFARYGFSKT